MVNPATTNQPDDHHGEQRESLVPASQANTAPGPVNLPDPFYARLSLRPALQAVLSRTNRLIAARNQQRAQSDASCLPTHPVQEHHPHADHSRSEQPLPCGAHQPDR